MHKKLSLVLFGILAFTMLVSAGDFNINYGGEKIFTVATSGAVNVSGTMNASAYYQNGVALSDIYLSLTGGTLTGVLLSDSMISTSGALIGSIDASNITSGTLSVDVIPTLEYHNITGIPSCDGTYESLSYDGTDFSCINITVPGNTTTIAYQNITNIPTCGAGDVLTFNGSILSCTTPTSSVSFENVAYINESQVFSGSNNFTEIINATGGLRLMSNESVITRDGVETTNITIDSNGNINVNLG